MNNFIHPFVILIELNLGNRGYFGNLLYQPTQSKSPENLLNQMGKVLIYKHSPQNVGRISL
jgi:hypothetical protein